MDMGHPDGDSDPFLRALKCLYTELHSNLRKHSDLIVPLFVPNPARVLCWLILRGIVHHSQLPSVIGLIFARAPQQKGSM